MLNFAGETALIGFVGTEAEFQRQSGGVCAACVDDAFYDGTAQLTMESTFVCEIETTGYISGQTNFNISAVVPGYARAASASHLRVRTESTSSCTPRPRPSLGEASPTTSGSPPTTASRRCCASSRPPTSGRTFSCCADDRHRHVAQGALRLVRAPGERVQHRQRQHRCPEAPRRSGLHPEGLLRQRALQHPGGGPGCPDLRLLRGERRDVAPGADTCREDPLRRRLHNHAGQTCPAGRHVHLGPSV